ncbi:MAG: hypothetical protein IJL99_01390 [Firmicutes bacterium]|nr:hypothetical protein [Bacillota bacterium]
MSKTFIADKETLDKVYAIVSDNDCYGFIEHCAIKNPAQRIEYIGLNKNYTPLTVDKAAHTFSLGSWATFPVLTENKPYMVKSNGAEDYQLSETDYTKKADGVTSSDVADDTYDGGAFSKLIRIYRKQEWVGHDRIVLFSFEEKEGFTADGFGDAPCRWIPMFYGSIDTNGKAHSTANTHLSKNKTTAEQYTAIQNFNANAKFFGGPIVEVIIDLLMMFAKTSDMQGAYGDGNMSGYDASDTTDYGMKTNNVVGGGQFYGSTDGTSLNKILHSVVLGSYSQWMRDPYEVVVNGKVKVSKDYTYDPTGATYEDTGIMVPNIGNWTYPLDYYPVKGYGSIPIAPYSGGSTAEGPCDGTYVAADQSTKTAVSLRFGYCDNGAHDGVRARNWNHVATNTYWNFGFALFL